MRKKIQSYRHMSYLLEVESRFYDLHAKLEHRYLPCRYQENSNFGKLCNRKKLGVAFIKARLISLTIIYTSVFVKLFACNLCSKRL